MGKDIKWICIFSAAFFIALFGAIAIDSMAKSRCKIEAIHNHIPVEQAERFCR